MFILQVGDQDVYRSRYSKQIQNEHLSTESTFNMNISSTESTFNMNISSNLTHHEQNGICLKEDTVLLIFTLLDIFDKLLVLVTNGGTIIIIEKR